MVSTISAGGGYGMNSRPPTGNMVFGLEIEGHSMPTSYKKTKVEPKDHMRVNLRRLREIQRSVREKESESNQPVKALWKSSKYDNVTSKVLEDLKKEPLPPRPQSANYLRAHSRTGLPLSARPASTTTTEQDPPAAPRAATARESRPSSAASGGGVDYVKLNGILARKYNLIRSASMSSLDDPSAAVTRKQQHEQQPYKIGHVPKYLIARRQELLEVQRLREAQSDPDLPPGHRLMPDSERRDTLERIKQKRQELEQEIALLPISSDTLRVKKKREELEQKLAKVDEAVRIFSRPKVYVRLDS